jgi:molybdate transport repressor ModE-like protein
MLHMTRPAQLVPHVVWRTTGPAGVPLDARVVPLLDAIRRAGTLRAAVVTTGISYRAAWGLLAATGEELGAPVAILARGRGARVAPLGERLLAADATARGALADAGVDVQLAPARTRRSAGAPPPGLHVAASHDLALVDLRDAWAEAGALRLELDTHGSVESLAALRRGDVEVAGFHVASDGLGAEELLRGLDPRRDVLVRFARRRQGLIVPRGSRVRSLADVARRRLRFVNRQRGSGTRVLVDQLLRAQGVDAAALRGYATEEFTHLAVAATVAAGKADAGFGLEAAARRFELAFVPIAEERYLFACRRGALSQPGVQRFRELLAGATTRRIVATLAGYALDGAGRLTDPAALRPA